MPAIERPDRPLTIDLAASASGKTVTWPSTIPGRFETEKPFLVVNLDEACRRQQVGEGWFRSLDEVPGQAISMSIRQIMKSAAILCTVPTCARLRASGRPWKVGDRPPARLDPAAAPALRFLYGRAGSLAAEKFAGGNFSGGVEKAANY